MRRVEGFSLAELVMVIVILGILAIFVGPILFNAMRSYGRIETSVVTQAKMRYAMERMVREMRDIRRQTTDSSFLDITSMTVSSMAFFKTDGTQVLLTGVGNVVNLAYPGSLAGMLTDQLQAGSFALAYFQQDAVTAAASSVSLSFVQISMTVTEGSNAFPARVRVDLRNPR
jgi:prepilin-type N-terminal cleavage/methylation domain-containing protein